MLRTMTMPALVVVLGIVVARTLFPSPASRGASAIAAFAETPPVGGSGDRADDPAIVHNDVIGSDKGSGASGGLGIYSQATGSQERRYTRGDTANVDVRTGLPLGASQRVALVCSSQRNTAQIECFRKSSTDDTLTLVGTHGVNTDLYGLCMYRDASASPDKYYVFTTYDSGRVEQYSIVDASRDGDVDFTLVRTFDVGSLTEGCAADDNKDRLFLSEEDVALWQYGALPSDGTSRIAVDRVQSLGGRLQPDIEGVDLYEDPSAAHDGYIIVSSQGDSTFHVYNRDDEAWRGSFHVSGSAGDEVTNSDGVAVSQADQLLVVHDTSASGGSSNYKFVHWTDVKAALGLE